MKSLSRVRLLATSWTAAYQAPLSMGFSRQECWSGLPLPSPMHEIHSLYTLERPLDCKEIQPVHSEGDQPWDFFGRNDAKSWNSSTLATSCEELTHWKRLWSWEGVGARGEGDDRGWDGWMASLTQWTWVSVNSRSWWWTGRPGVLQFMGWQRVGHDWATDLIWCDTFQRFKNSLLIFAFNSSSKLSKDCLYFLSKIYKQIFFSSDYTLPSALWVWWPL